MEVHHPVAALARADVNFCLIDEHDRSSCLLLASLK
jgi:hypothetical protein